MRHAAHSPADATALTDEKSPVEANPVNGLEEPELYVDDVQAFFRDLR